MTMHFRNLLSAGSDSRSRGGSCLPRERVKPDADRAAGLIRPPAPFNH